MIYYMSDTLASLLTPPQKLKPVNTKARPVSLWGEWICDVHTIDSDFGYPTSRIVMAINTKTAFSVFFPLDSQRDYEDFSQTLFSYIYWTLDLYSLNIDGLNLLGFDILKAHYYQFRSGQDKAALTKFAKSIERFTKNGEKNAQDDVFEVLLPTAIWSLNSRPRKELGGKSPCDIVTELIKNKVTPPMGKGDVLM